MCPFKKAFPFVLFLHLLFAVGIFASYAQHSTPRIFTLLPALGVGELLHAGQAHASGAQVTPAPKITPASFPRAEVKKDDAPAANISKKIETTPALQAISAPSKTFHTPPATITAPAGAIAANSPAPQARVGSDMPAERLGGPLTPPMAVHKPKPVRPAASARGEVVLDFTINEAGTVERVSVEDSPSPEMTAAVMAVLPKWRFTPAQQDGKVIPLRVRQVVKF